MHQTMHYQMRQAHAAPAIKVISYNPKMLPFVIISNYYRTRTAMLYKSSIHPSHHIFLRVSWWIHSYSHIPLAAWPYTQFG